MPSQGLPTLHRVDFEALPYADVWQWQKQLVETRIQGQIPDVLLLGEHPPVYTLGRGTHPENLGDTQAIPVISVERGGDVTYHGPGQLVGYPIIQLAPGERDLKQLLLNIELALISTLAQFDLKAHRLPGKTGVWVGDLKVASIGVAVKKWVTYHGFALNVCPDMTPFHGISPCGFAPEVMTSVAQLQPNVSWPQQWPKLTQVITETLAHQLHRTVGTSETLQSLLPPCPHSPHVAS